MDEVQLSQGYRATTRKQLTFLKAESTLEPLSSFELETPGLGIQRKNIKMHLCKNVQFTVF